MTLWETLQYDVTSEDCAVSLVPTGSSCRHEAEWGQVLGCVWGEAFYRAMADLYSRGHELWWEIDLSTVCTYAQASTAILAWNVESYEMHRPPEDIVDYDTILTMPAPRRHTLSLGVKSIMKASPHIEGGQGP